MIKFQICIIVFIILNINFSSHAQTISDTFDQAENCMLNKQKDSARNLFLRVIFFDSTSNFKLKSFQYLTEIEIDKGNFLMAQQYLEAILNLNDSSINKNEIIIRKAYYYLLQKNYELCIAQLYQINIEKNKEFLVQKKMLESFAYMGLDSVKIAKANLLSFMKTAQDSNYVSSIFNLNSTPFNKSLNKANIMSALLPGLGQIYLNDWKKGITSTFVVGSFSYLFVNTWIVYGFIPSFLTIFPWTFRYYSGGIIKNELIFKSKKLEASDKIYFLILQYLTNQNYIEGVYSKKLN